MKKSPITKILVAFLLVASLSSFLFLQEVKQLPQNPLDAKLSLVDDVELTQQDTYFPHIELVKKVLDMGIRVLKIGI